MFSDQSWQHQARSEQKNLFEVRNAIRTYLSLYIYIRIYIYHRLWMMMVSGC